MTNTNAAATKLSATAEWFRLPWACGHNDAIYMGDHAQECSVCGLRRGDAEWTAKQTPAATIVKRDTFTTRGGLTATRYAISFGVVDAKGRTIGMINTIQPCADGTFFATAQAARGGVHFGASQMGKTFPTLVEAQLWLGRRVAGSLKTTKPGK